VSFLNENGIGICTYNRCAQIGELIEATLATTKDCKIVVADDGSTDDTAYVVSQFPSVIYLRGPNLGVAHNKNRALYALQSCRFIAVLEDDLFPTQPGWFEKYREASSLSGIHHFCRVQDKEVEEVIPEFGRWMSEEKKLTPIYGPSPRGDLTFVTTSVLRTVGGFNPEFMGVGFAHGEWSNRVFNAGLIPHPNKWVDIREARDLFVQKGDTTGGRWMENQASIKEQLKKNRAVQRKLKASRYVFCPLELR